jgi:hypothetical protein
MLYLLADNPNLQTQGAASQEQHLIAATASITRLRDWRVVPPDNNGVVSDMSMRRGALRKVFSFPLKAMNGIWHRTKLY